MALYLGHRCRHHQRSRRSIVDAATGAQLTVESAPQPDPLPTAPPGRSEVGRPCDPLDARRWRSGRAAVAACGRRGGDRGDRRHRAAARRPARQHRARRRSAPAHAADRLAGQARRRAGCGRHERPRRPPRAPRRARHARHRLRDGERLPRHDPLLAAGAGRVADAGRPRHVRPRLSRRLPLRAGLPVTDPTDAGGAGLFDAAHGRWHAGMLAALDLPAALLPPVEPTGTLIGTLGTAGAVALGLPVGVPVMNALGDNQASFFGSVGAATDALLVNVGTGGRSPRSPPVRARRAAGDAPLPRRAGICSSARGSSAASPTPSCATSFVRSGASSSA